MFHVVFRQIDSGEDAQEEFGWKLVHGDVFRPPRKGMLLSVLLGSGAQLFCMALVTLGMLNCISFVSGYFVQLFSAIYIELKTLN